MNATNLIVCDEEDEDYIDMEITPSPPRTLRSSPQSREFEFQMSTAANDRETTTSPADELFYKGKLLPLYLPPRRQMLQNLHHHHHHHHLTAVPFEADVYYSSMPSTNAANTPLDSCNISPSESRRVSWDLNSDDYFFEWSNELNTFINNHPTTKITWPKKLKSYLKSFFFFKPSSSHGSSTKPSSEKSRRPSETTYPTIATMSIINNIEVNAQRRSFSDAIKRHSPTKYLSSSSTSSNSSSGSSSFSLNSNGSFHELHYLRRSSSATEIERSIEGAIAHCKKSQSASRSL